LKIIYFNRKRHKRNDWKEDLQKHKKEK